MSEKITLTQLAKRFYDLFRGLDKAHGVYKVDENNDKIGENYRGTGKKKQGKAYTVKKEWGIENWKDHLTGKQGLGIIPIKDDSTVHWGAIDIDRYDLNIVKFCKQVEYTWLIPCRTKSGGIHLYCFTSEPVPASLMKRSLEEVAKKLGFGGCEIFPKQEKVIADRGDIGNWINMPYFNAKSTVRFAILNGERIGPREFVEKAEKLKHSKSQLKRIADYVRVRDSTEAFPDGPPCLNFLSEFGFPKGCRDNALFDLGVYYRKASPDHWREEIEKSNQKYMKPPLSRVEIDKLIKSLERKSYTYKCKDIPICDHCDKGLCLQKKFGISGEDDSKFPNLESLTKVDAEPPVYFLSVNSQRIGPIESDVLLDQGKFSKLSFEYLAIIPPRLKQQDWRKMMQGLLDTQSVVEVAEEDKPKYDLLRMLDEFCTGRSQTTEKQEIMIGRVYYDEGEEANYFRLNDFIDYLNRKRWYKYDQNDIIAIFSELGLKRSRLRIKGNNSIESRPWVWRYAGERLMEIEPVKVEESPY